MSNSLTVSDNETGSGVFLLEYNVAIEVCTQMWGEDSSEQCKEERKYLSTVARLEKPMVVTHCVPHWNGLDFNFTIHWTVQEFVAYGNDIFIGFLVVIEDRIAKRFIRSNDVNKIANRTEYSYKWFNLPPLEKDTTYKFTVSIQWQSSDSYKQPSVFDASCTRPAVPPPSNPVLDVRLSEFEFSEETMEVQFRVEWNPPTTPNGQITHYLACLGGRNIPNFEEGPGDVKDGNDTTCQNIDKEKRSFAWKTRLPRPDCIYFQMRAHTKLAGAGSWSEAVVISDKDISKTNTCSTPPSFEPLQAQRESPESSATYVPVLGGLGAVIGLTLLALLVALTVVCGRIRRRKRRIQHVLARQMSDEMDLMFTGGAKKSLSSRKELLITADEWEIPPEQVIVEGNIGEGAFGEVLKGAVKGPLSNPKVPRALKSSICIPVAIKMLKTSAKGGERRDFLSEIEMMKKVSAGQNPHVVSMVGCVTVQEPLSLITEFVPYGNLLQYLRTNQRLYTDRTEGDEEDMTTTYTDLGNIISTDLISFAYQIASGMEYLSSLGIVHRDVACRNILVGEDKVLKITDLGMSRETDEVYVQKTKGRVPLKWMAVESIITREFTSASDVWAYGVVLWEIGTLGGFPYPTIQNEDLLPLLKRGYRLEKPDNCSSDVYAIMLECWQEDPGKRPTFTGLRARFDSMLLAEKKDTYIDLQIDATKPYYNPELATDVDVNPMDNLLHVGGKSPKSGSRISATSPFHIRGISPACLDDTSDPPAMLRGQRSPRSLSPVPVPAKLPRPASLQLLTERKNANPYVDDPSTRRSIHISPPEWSVDGQQGGANDGTAPVQMGINWDGVSNRSAARRGSNYGRDDSTLPEIFISFS
jgi:proto-oncogene tyrosine-protein kinase Ret